MCVSVKTKNSVVGLDSGLHTGEEKTSELEVKIKEITQDKYRQVVGEYEAEVRRYEP